jgi:hypothetical protein
MGKLKTSLDLFKRSVSVIAQNRALLLFPIIALVLVFIIVLFFISPFVLSNTGHALTDPLHWKTLADRIKLLAENKDMLPGASGFAWFAVFYLVSVLLGTFFNVAFYNEIFNALNGNQVSIIRGIRVARAKIKFILTWSMFAGVVGIIINTLEDKFGFVGRWVLRLIGIAWSVASIFVIPVIIREEKSTSPLKLLKSSALMLKKTWGETVIGFMGISIGFGIFTSLTLILILITVPIVFGLLLANFWAAIATVFLEIICLLAFAFFWSLASNIYRCALYMYASEGIVPGPFDEEMMNMAWKVKVVKKEQTKG